MDSQPDRLPEVYQLIAQVVAEAPACAPFRRALHRCIRPPSSAIWPSLPMLCCEAASGESRGQRGQAVGRQSRDERGEAASGESRDQRGQATGGQPEHGLILAAAFELARMAADVLDDVQDGDTLDALWRELGPAQAINLGLGLSFAAQLALSRLRGCGVPDGVVTTLQEDFAWVGFQMCAGQYLDLANEREGTLTLARYWEMAAAKSGAFFALGCWAGARVGGASDPQVALYAQFGHHLGLLAQIANDLAGLYGHDGKADLARRKQTLPLVFALTVARGETRSELEAAWRAATHDPAAQARVRELVIALGAPQYLLLAAEDHYRHAAAALSMAQGESQALAGLRGILEHVRPLKNKTTNDPWPDGQPVLPLACMPGQAAPVAQAQVARASGPGDRQ